MPTKSNSLTRNRTVLPLAAVVATLATAASAQTTQPALPPTEIAPVSAQLVLDASGSMNGKLGDGVSKISAARAAVQTLVTTLPEKYALSLRAYGFQSPTSLKNCRDSLKLVDFASGREAQEDIVSSMRDISARGYTPISYSLREAGNDLAGAGESHHVLILVSDGRERCDGDPCATARTLAAKDPRLIIHTVGFAVGTVARDELRCVAREGRGKYFHARDSSQLSERLESLPPLLASLPLILPPAELPEPPPTNGLAPALPPQDSAASRSATLSDNRTPAPVGTPNNVRRIVVKRERPGRLTVEPAGNVHRIIDPETDRVVAALGETKPSVELPAGTYNVTFGNGVWRSVDVEPRKTTRLRPAIIEVDGATLTGHDVVDTETGEVLANLTAAEPSAVLIPTVVGVKFGPVMWPDVVLEEGETRVLKPGILTIDGADESGHNLRTNTETVVTRLTPARPTLPLPPGNYALTIDGKRVPFSIREGERLIVEVQ